MRAARPIAVVPARLGSTRLERKPLADVGGAPLVVRVCENLTRGDLFARILVATDAREVAEVVEAAGYESVLTAATLPSGTDRVAEACRLVGLAAEAVVVNVQGDEPFVDADLLRAVVGAIAPGDAHVVTPVEPLRALGLLDDRDVVKAVLGERGRALYFSRRGVPFVREAVGEPPAPGLFYRHVGVYAYTRATLERLTAYAPHPLELAERLEQLRWLAHGEEVRCVRVEPSARGVDTEEDRRRADAHYRQLRS